MHCTIESETLDRLASPARRGAFTAIGEVAQRIAAQAGIWAGYSWQRARLSRMDDRLLKDIGLDRATALREVDKWFWQP